MKLVFISDTHTFQNEVSVPDGDFIFHSGDYTFTGNIPEVNKFLVWFSNLPHTHKILINGNHEREFWQNPALYKALIPDNIVYLEDEEIQIDGLKIYGSPHTIEFGSWAYPYYTEEEARQIWARIPDDTDILLTHQPPYGIRDGAPFMKGREGLYVPCLDSEGFSVGCKELLEKVKNVRPLIHAFGHIHEGAGYTQIDETLYINAAVADGQYKLTNPATVVTLDENKKIINIEQYEIN